MKKEALRTEIEMAIAETRKHALEEYESVDPLAQLLWNNQPCQIVPYQLFTFQAKFIQDNLPSVFHIALHFATGLEQFNIGKCAAPLSEQIEELTNKLISKEESYNAEIRSLSQLLEDGKAQVTRSQSELQHLHLKLQEMDQQLQSLFTDCQEAHSHLLSLEAENESLKDQCQIQASQLTECRYSLDETMKRKSLSEGRLEALNDTLRTTLQQYQALMASCKAKRKRCLLLKREKQSRAVQLEESLIEANHKNSLAEARLRNWGITTDPPNESQEPVPDFSTPKSRAALERLGPYSDQDSELLLVRRDPVVEKDGVYIGQWNTRSKKHGYGQFLFTNGNRYEGQWRNGWKTGKGRYIWANGDVYIGDFVQDKYEGFGTYYSAEGDEYSGGWVNDYAQGIGSHKYGSTQNTGDRYFGEFFKDKFHGVGAYFEADGTMSVGSWKSGKFHGKGMKGWPDDGSMYFGGFVDSHQSGTGCYIWPDGDVYQGEWKSGTRYGQGRLTHPGNIDEGVWTGDVFTTTGARR